jgi:hypothetical protein
MEFRANSAPRLHSSLAALELLPEGIGSMKRLVLIAAALAATTATASAHDYSYDRGDRIDARENRQAARIAHGRRAGELTWFESFKLKREQARIHRLERWAKRDGHVDRYEARRIEDAQDRAGRHIYEQRHDGQKAWWRRW